MVVNEIINTRLSKAWYF